MKTITLSSILALFLLFVGFGGLVVTMALVDNSFLQSLVSRTNQKNIEAYIPVNKCSQKEKINTQNTSDPVLLTLETHQQMCDSFITDRMMLFTDMPKDNTVARSSANAMANRLKEFSKLGITPLVIIEPSSEWGLIDFQEFNTGFYDSWIEEYFRVLKENGVTQEQMGIWVPFPEANIPTWNKNSATPRDFALGVNRYGRILKEYYPDTHISILLNSATYENEDYDWLYGEYVSLKPYVEFLDKNLISSVGLQGFPWVPQLSSASNPLEDPSQFLNHRLAQEAADIIGIKEIWFNTGSFGAKYTQQPLETATVDPSTRKTILTGIAGQAKALQDKDYNVWINLFIEDKSNVAEQTDWSFKGQENQQILKEFIRSLEENKILLSIFDQKIEVIE